jgi:hypothetical protein
MEVRALVFGDWSVHQQPLWVRISRALEDADPFPHGIVDASDDEGMCLALSAVGAALNDDYVWPIYGYLSTEAA